MKLRIVFMIFCAGMLVQGGVVRADGGDMASLEKHFRAGRELYQAGKYEDAANELRKAYEVRKLPVLWWNLAVVYERLAITGVTVTEHWDKAIQYYERYLEDAGQGGDTDAVRARVKLLDDERNRLWVETNKADRPPEIAVSQAVAELAAGELRGAVVIDSEPPGAVIQADGKDAPLGRTPWSGELTGEHALVIEHKGYESYETTVKAASGELVVVVATLKEKESLGWVEITANVPGAAIYMDDKGKGVFAKTPYSGNVKPGKHKIWITADGYNEFTTEVEIASGLTHTVSAKLDGSPVGYLSVHGRGVDKGVVYVDGRVMCKGGPCRHAIPQGKHQVTVERSGYKSYYRTVHVEAGSEMTLNVQLAKDHGRGDALWAYLFTAAFAGGGVYMSLQSQNIYQTLDEEIVRGAPPPDNNDPRFTHGKLYALGADVAYGLASFTLLTAVYYTVRDKGPPSKGSLDMRPVTVAPRIAPEYAGIGMEVTW